MVVPDVCVASGEDDRLVVEQLSLEQVPHREDQVGANLA